MSEITIAEIRDANPPVDDLDKIVCKEAFHGLLTRAYRLAGWDDAADEHDAGYCEYVSPPYLQHTEHMPEDLYAKLHADARRWAWHEIDRIYPQIRKAVDARRAQAEADYIAARDANDRANANAALRIIGRIDREVPYVFGN